MAHNFVLCFDAWSEPYSTPRPFAVGISLNVLSIWVVYGITGYLLDVITCSPDSWGVLRAGQDGVQ